MSNGSFPQAGFYYQNNVAALKILSLLDISSDLLDVSLENYDKGKHIDDIILTKKENIDFFQVKWANEITKSYTIYNLAFQVPEGSDKSLWKKLADGYASKITEGKKANIILYSPRLASNSKLPSKGINKGLNELITFQVAFKNAESIPLEDIPKYKEFKPLLDKLKTESGLSEKGFIDFFKTLHFNLEAPELEYIKLQLQNKAFQLGLEETQIIKLLDLVVQWSISGVSVTRDKLLLDLGIRDRFVDRLSQVFKIDESNYVENTDLFEKLDALLSSINNGYVYIEGVPGAGKSTALTKYASQNKQIRFSYYCFIPDETTTKELRLKGEYFLKSLCIAIEKGFPEVDLPIRYSENYEDKLSQYFDKISALGEKIVFLIDGLDHVDRNKEILNNPLTSNILSSLPENLIIILSSQYMEALPPNVRAEINNDETRHIKLSRFSEAQIRIYLEKRSLSLTDEQISALLEKSEGIPLYLRYITSILDDRESREYDTIIEEFPKLVDGKINTYHNLLYQKIESDNIAKWILSLLANRKEYTSIEVLKTILKIAEISYDILQISQSLKSFKHLLKEKDGIYYTIFHNSFREYIITNTEEIRLSLNTALVKYYEEDIFEEEAFRNYFAHLFYLKDYETIIKKVNAEWINESWRRYRPLSDIIENINIAWNSCVQICSISEFVRIAFLKHQMDFASFNLSNGSFEESTYFLEAGLSKESLRTIWDGEFPLAANEEYFNFYSIKYFAQTGNVIPFSIATQFFTTFLAKATSTREPGYHNNDKSDFGTYLKAKSLYLKPSELTNEIMSLREYIDIDDLKSLIQYLGINNKLACILELWELFKESPLKHYALAELLMGLWKQQNSDASNYENKFSFNQLEEQEKINFLEKIISNIPGVEFIEKYKSVSIEPSFDEEIISSEYDYKVKVEFLNLLQTLKVFYFLDEANYASFDIKLSGLPQYPRMLYFAISSCAKLWSEHKKVHNPGYSINDFKKVIDYLTIPEYVASNINSQHGAKSFIKYQIHKINEIIFKCFNEICTDNDFKELIPYWIEKHDKNGFYDYQSDLAFAAIIVDRPELNEAIYDLLKHSELLARESHDTSGLVESLTKIGSLYGKAGRMEDYNRIYQELLSIACGVSYRKDYQFANIFSVLEDAHKLNPDATLQRLADNYYLLFKVKDAGNARMLHICLSELFGLIIKYYPQLAFKLLVRDDQFLGRDEAMYIVISDILPESNDNQIPYLWAIIKTINKWEGFKSDHDDNIHRLYLEFFKRLVTYSDLDFVKNCYLYLHRQFLVEQNLPLKILKINEILEKSSYLYDFIKIPDPKLNKDIAKPFPVNSGPKEKLEKFKRQLIKLDTQMLSELAAVGFNEIGNYIVNYQETLRFNKLHPLWIELYQNANKHLAEWFNALSPDLKLLVEAARTKCKRAYLSTLNQVAKEKNIRKQNVLKFVDQVIHNIQELLPGTNFRLYVDKEIDLSILIKHIIQNGRVPDFNAQNAIPEKDLLDFLSACPLEQVSNWEDLILKFFDKPIIAHSYLKLSQRVFTYDRDMARSLLEKAFRIADGISYKENNLHFELLDWAYKCLPEKANYFVLHSFYAEHVDRQSELMYYVSKKLRPWVHHFKEPAFYETYYKANYEYNIILAEGLPEPIEIDTSIITENKETLDFKTITINYLVDLFNYPIVKIRHLALDALFDLYKYNPTLFQEYVLNSLKGKSSNQIEHFLILLYSLSINHTSSIGDLINKMGWAFQTGHYNIQETYADLIKYHVQNGTQIESHLQSTAQDIHKKPFFPQPGIIRPLLNKENFAFSWHLNELIREIDELDEINFSGELYTLLTEEGFNEITSKQTEAQVHRNYNMNSNFDSLEINGPVFKIIHDKINRLFFKQIQQGHFDDRNIQELKSEFRIYDPTEILSLRVSKPEYVFWKGKETDENQFIQFVDIDELIAAFLARQEEVITLFEKGYQRIDVYPSYFSQYFEIAIVLADPKASVKKIEAILTGYNSYLSHHNLYRTEIASFFASVDQSHKIGNVVYPLIGVSDKYFRHKLEDSLAVLLPYISNVLELSPVPNSLNYIDKNKTQVIEFIEWQDPFKDHDRRRFEPLSQGCTLNINKSLLKEYANQRGLDIYASVTLRRSIDKYKPESQMDWVEQLFVKKISL